MDATFNGTSLTGSDCTEKALEFSAEQEILVDESAIIGAAEMLSEGRGNRVRNVQFSVTLSHASNAAAHAYLVSIEEAVKVVGTYTDSAGRSFATARCRVRGAVAGVSTTQIFTIRGA